MLTRVKNYFLNNWDMVGAVGITVIMFFLLFGWKAIDLYNIGLVTQGQDFTVSYLGGVFYRLDEWRWPIFTHMNVAYPYGISVHGTDAGPLLVLIFKALHKFFGLSPYVQFAGLWTFICYVLQAVASVLIFRHVFKNKFLVIVGAMFFISSPLLITRAFEHINLTCQFILLFAILLYLNNKLGLKEWIYMGILTTLSVLTCPYFLPMTYAFFLLLWYQKAWVEKSIPWKTIFIGVAALLVVFAFWFYILGFVSMEQRASTGGWRLFGMDVLAPFVPIWSKSTFINNVLVTGGQRDIENYLGVGVLILFVFFFKNIWALFSTQNLKKHALMAFILFGFFFFALSPKINIARHTVFDYNPGYFIDWLGGVFRYSSRFFWPIWYLLVFYLIKLCHQYFGKKAILILPLVLFIQLYDIYPTYIPKMKMVSYSTRVKFPLKDPRWEKLMKKYDNIFVFKQYWLKNDLWQLAARYNKNINFGFLNRQSLKVNREVNRVQTEILSGYVSDPSYLYIIDDDLIKKIKKRAPKNPAVQKLYDSLLKMDGYYVLEYSPDLFNPKDFKPYQINASHPSWTGTLTVVLPGRIVRRYEAAEGIREDYGNIESLTNTELVVEWDQFSKERFTKEPGETRYQYQYPAQQKP